MITKAIKTRVFREGEDLLSFLTTYLKRLPEGAVVVITSKIVSLAEQRTATIENVQSKEKLMRAESELVLPTKYGWLTVRQGEVMAAAGIDESNANGKFILLPRDSFRTARLLRRQLQQKYKVKRLGVLITDSRTLPLRAGVTGVALGYAGFRGLKDYRGQADIFGRRFKFSRTDIADSLATAAVLVMGEGAEQQPLALIQHAPIDFCERTKHNELHIDIASDLYAPLFSTIRTN